MLMKDCPYCDGFGELYDGDPGSPSTPVSTCPHCGGTGKTPIRVKDLNPPELSEVPQVPEWIDENAVAEFLSLSKSSVRSLLRDGLMKNIRRIKLGKSNNSALRYSKADLDHWVKENSTGRSPRIYITLNQDGQRIDNLETDPDLITPLLKGWAKFGPTGIQEIAQKATEDAEHLSSLRSFASKSYESNGFQLDVRGV